MRAKKSLSQNFLKRKSIAQKVVGVAEVTKDDTVLEIGPGKGILTSVLLERASRVIAIEKDTGLVTFLKDKFKEEIAQGTLVLLEGDVLDIPLLQNMCQYIQNDYKLVANIPYAITGKILRTFLGLRHQPTVMSLLVQKEVAERITARDGKESLLSVSIKAYGDPSSKGAVKRGNFHPEPKVDSAILLIENISKDFFDKVPEKDFFNVVHAGFAHKRKQLKGNLRKAFPDRAFQLDDVRDDIRAEKLSVDDWKRILL